MMKIKSGIPSFIIASIVIIIASGSLCAQQKIYTVNKGKITKREYSPGVIISSIMSKDSSLTTFIYDPNETVKLIVEFKSSPLSRLNKNNTKQVLGDLISAKSNIENEHTAFKNDLAQIESKAAALSNSLLKSSGTKVVFEYKTALNGTAITTKRWVMQEVEKLSYVKSVYEDVEMKVLDDTSNNVIGADSVWAKLGLTGKGIKIGIIDTGIDYMHPDLGGGFGPNYKVIGGYDFVNKDNDPMDDHGHGTHVAGIAAANGLLKGVAPDAKLYAFKVLNENGSGDESTVIAGIDRAMDPDNNPLTDDAVNIISMSLGGSGNPDDPASQAIDNATAAGIICVIAAGNSGNYQTIGSPGCARTALTVGATDNNDIIARFSSRGPSNIIFNIKPDILAPGVSINSDKLGGGYITYSGTSMATPHVAGCAALILQLHPDWTPAMVKAVLMESAKDIGKNIWTQGDGRVDILNAFSQTNICMPATISLGVDDISQTFWTVIDTLKIYNNSSVTQTYSYSDAGNINGVDIAFSSPDLTISPYQSADLVVTFVINNSIVQFSSNTPPAYTGNILVYSSSKNINITYSFMKSPMMQLNFDDNDALFIDVIKHNNTKKSWFAAYPGYNITFLLPQDIYDIFITYNNLTTVVKENINLTNIELVRVSKQEAKNTITFNMVDEHGSPILINTLCQAFTDSNSYPIIDNFILTTGPVTLKTSDISSNISFEWAGINSLDPAKIYKTDGFTKGVSQSINYKNDPNLYRHLQFKYDVTSTIQNFNLQEWIYCSTYNTLYNIGALILGLNNNNNLTSPFVQDGYYMPPPYDNFSFSFLGKGSETFLSTSPLFNIKGADSLYGYLPFTGQVPVLKTTLTKIPINFGPPHWFGKFANSSSGISIIPPVNSDNEPFFFCNQTQGYNENIFSTNDIKQIDSLKYHLYSNSALIDSGYINNKYSENYYKWGLNPGAYCLKIDGLPNSYINNRKVNAFVKANFDTRLSDPNPPTLHSLNIISDGEYVDEVDPSKLNKVQFNINDDNGLKSVLLELQSDKDTAWQKINLVQNDSTFTANIPATIQKGFVALRITGTDNSGNILMYNVEPAFKYGIDNAPSTFSLLTPKDMDTLKLYTPTVPLIFKWNSSEDIDTDDSLRYKFSMAGPGFDTSITGIRDTTLSLNVMSLLKKQSVYNWNVSVTDGSIWTASVDSFYLFTSAIISGIDNKNGVPAEYSLSQNYPNPFNPVTTINYALPKPGLVSLKVYNIIGQEVAVLVNEEKKAGNYSIKFPSNNIQLSSGVYLYKIQAGDFISVKKLILLK